MNKAALISRLFLGLIFTVMGFNHFLQFIATPGLPASAQSFMTAMGGSYMLDFVHVVEIVAGVMLLLNLYILLAILALIPIVLNIFLFHLILAPGMMLILAFLLGVAELILGYAYMPYFDPLFTARPRVMADREEYAGSH